MLFRFPFVALALIGNAGAAESAALNSWPASASPREIGRRVVENFLPREHRLTPQDGTIHYAEACVWYGALTFAQLAGERDLQSALVRRYTPLLDPVNDRIMPKREHVDWSVWGIVPLEIYIQTRDPRFLPLGLAKADAQWSKPKPGGLSPQTRFWIDDMYMITVLQAQAYRATHDPVYLERAAREMVAYLAKLQQPTGLFFHGEKAPFYWGRGNGWVAAGMTELLRDLPQGSPERARIMEGYQKMMVALLDAQDSHGLWHQLVNDPAAWPETSGSGMFTFAFITGVRQRWLDAARFGPAARKGWIALAGCLDGQGNIRDVCAGMGQRPSAAEYLKAKQVSGDYHGQAPLLWCASALLRP